MSPTALQIQPCFLWHVCCCVILQGKLCWVLQWLAVLLGVGGTAKRLVNAQTLQVGRSSAKLAVKACSQHETALLFACLVQVPCLLMLLCTANSLLLWVCLTVGTAVVQHPCTPRGITLAHMLAVLSTQTIISSAANPSACLPSRPFVVPCVSAY